MRDDPKDMPGPFMLAFACMECGHAQRPIICDPPGRPWQSSLAKGLCPECGSQQTQSVTGKWLRRKVTTGRWPFRYSRWEDLRFVPRLEPTS